MNETQVDEAVAINQAAPRAVNEIPKAFTGQAGAVLGGLREARPVDLTDEQRKELEAKWEAQKKEQEQREIEGKASHSIAQAAFILGLFAKEEIFKYGAGTDFASAISKLAIATITENGKVFE